MIVEKVGENYRFNICGAGTPSINEGATRDNVASGFIPDGKAAFKFHDRRF